MFRNAITILMCLAGFLSAAAQTATGWYKYPTFSDKVDNMIQNRDLVYYRSGANLFSYNETDQENFAYSTENYLSDVNVKEIYYNPEKKFLVVAYENGNLDLLFDDGRNINLPEIKNANVHSTRQINGVSFNGDKMYVATGFGYVVFDTKRLEVKESAVFNEPITWVGANDEYVVIYHDKTYKKAPLSGLHTRLENFTAIAEQPAAPKESFVTEDGNICVRNTYNEVTIIDPATDQIKISIYVCTQPMRPSADKYYSYKNGALMIIDLNGKQERTVALPAEAQTGLVSYYSNPDQVWSATSDGIAKYSTDGTLLVDRIMPADCITVPKVTIMKWSPDYERLYLSRGCPAKGRPGNTDNNSDYQITNVIENREPRDVSLKECTLAHYWNGGYFQDVNKNKRMYGGFSWICENPYDKDMYFINSNWNGVLAAKDNKMPTSFTSDNAKYNAGVANRSDGVFVDPKNNLWVQTLGTPYLMVLPAEHLKPENILNVTRDDWSQTAVTANYGEKNFTMIFCSNNNMAYHFNGNWGGGLVAYDTKGTYADASDDAARQWTSIIDQDGKSFSPTYFYALAEDKNGQIWCGTSSGVCVITEPEKGLSEEFRVRRPKVARNDGTAYADYLIESDAVLWVGIDPANNKWLATQNSGLYLVNADGSEILAHYEKANSPLSTNTIYTVEQDPASNLVYVGTDDGLYRFYCSTSPAAEDYSEIYAYPNPVRPDFTGPITIAGLTEGSLVKIMDASGALVAQTTANGGMALWDGCNMQGHRVRSGVYYVFATSGPQEENAKGAVTKIIVIN